MSFFAQSEFYCRCRRPECDALREVSPDLLARLELLRLRVGRAIVVTSGLRCAWWNHHEGGVQSSEHLTGDAADLQALTAADRWQLIAANFEGGKTPIFTRLGIGQGFVHVGIGRPAHVVWTYPVKREVMA